MEFHQGVPLQQQDKDYKIQPSWLPATPAKPVPRQRPFVPGNGQMNHKSSQNAVSTNSLPSASNSHNDRPAMLTYSPAQGGWRWTPGTNPIYWNDITAASKNPFFTLLLQSQIGDGLGTHAHPNQLLNGKMSLSPSLSSEKTITMGVRDVMPSSSTPGTMEKNKFFQECLHQEITGLVQEKVVGGNALENESRKWQPPGAKQTNLCFYDLTVPTSFESIVSTSSACLIPSSSDFAMPSQVLPSERGQTEVRICISSEQDTQALTVEKNKQENQVIDLNRTPQQKPKRSKHRPKVIQEGKPARTPKPKTPKPVTPKLAKINGESSTGKRKYVRRKMGQSSSDAPSSVLVDIVEPNRAKTGKSVRRCLNFDSEPLEGIEACPGPAMASMHCAQLQTLDSCLRGTLNSSSAKSTIRSARQSEAVVENPASGMTLDLNGSANPMPYEYIRYSENPKSTPQLCTGENFTTNQIVDCRESMTENFSTPQSSERKLAEDNPNAIAKNNNYLKNATTGGRSQETVNIQSDSNGISVIMLKRTKRDHNDVQDTWVSDFRDSMHAYDGSSQLSECHDRSSHDLYLATRSKKKRIENKHNSFTLNTSLEGAYMASQDWRGDHMVFNHDLMTLEEQQLLEQILAFVEKQRSDVTVQGHESNFVSSTAGIIHTTTPLQQSGHSDTGIDQSSSVKPIRGSHAQGSGILEPLKWKDAHVVSTNSKAKPKRGTNKEQAQLGNSQSSFTYQVGLQGLMTASCNFDSSPVEKIPDSTASVSGDPSENISHPRTSSECQSDSSFQKSTGYNLMPGARKSYRDPLDIIIENLRHITITETHEDARAKAENAVVLYDGGGVMVPYHGQFDLVKKRYPRPKVDLDTETFRVWNLLMGKGGNDGIDGNGTDKEKWWEEERKVFHGRVDSFIARMHLVQGDRRFSKWKGSVVDSVVGVFLTQNVADHLSSSAFMMLAARFPSKLRGDNAEPQGEKRDVYMELQEKCIASLDYSSKLENHMLCKELVYLGSQMTMGENESSYSSESLGSNTRSDVSDYSRKCIGMHEVVDHKSSDNNIGIPLILTESTRLAETEDRWSLDDVASSQNSVVSSQTSSENQVQRTGQIELNSLSNFQVEDLMTRSMSNGISSSTSFTELLQMAERILPEQFQEGIGQSILDLSFNIGMSTTPSMPYCTNKSSRSGLVVDMGNSNVASYESRLKQLSDVSGMINTNGDKIFDASGDASAMTAVEVVVQHKLALIPENEPEDDPNASINKTFLQSATNSETETCITQQFFHHNNFQKEVKEASISEPIFQMHSHVQDEGTVDIQQNEVEKFQTESRDRVQTQMQNFGNQQNFPNFYNKQTTPVEVFEGSKSILENKSCNLLKVSAETTKDGLKEKRVRVKRETKETYDWDILRKEAQQNGFRKERTSDTMDSLDWEAVRCAKVNEISETIRERGMNNVLAERIKDFLNRLVKDHGSIDLEWLRDIEPDKAKDYLLSIRGLGLKSVECVRLLTLQHLAFPVDTNVGRICVRLGWVPLQPLPESLQLHLLELYPVLETIQKYLWPRLCKLDQRTLYELHYQMITFGKVFCTKSKPNCNACPMRAECKHFASAFASARLALPGLEEKSLVSSMMPVASEVSSMPVLQPLNLPQLKVNRDSKEINCYSCCEPIIEEPSTPEDEQIETEESAIEDTFYEGPDEIPVIKLNFEEFTQNLQSYMQEYSLQVKDGEVSKALVVLNPEAASIPMPKLKNVSRLRTEHHVYELPDSHPLLEGWDKREPDDPSSYLLAIWTPGETAQSTELPEAFCKSQELGKLCNKTTCFACNSVREAEAQTVRGTILIPCRTAMRGSFPLNGTYFQVNEVFADHDTSRNPVDVPREWIWNLPRRTVYFGTSVPTIFKGLTTQEIQHCFWRGFVCVRGFDRTTRAPRPLYARLHFPASKAPRKRKDSAAETRRE